MLKHIVEWLELTKTEQKVIVFLAITMLAGAGIRLYQVTFASAQQFDYSTQDSTFTTLSLASSDTASVSDSEVAGDEGGKVNINTAAKQQLMDLPGIGEVMAERILKYRNETGRFNKIEDIKMVKGITNKKFASLKPLIKTQ